MNFFAKNLKYFREKKKIEQQVMADALGVAPSTVSCWEKGIRSPDLDMVANIAEYLNIYEDFIRKDLTIDNDITNDNKQDRILMLYNKSKHMLSKDDLATMEFIMQKTIDNYENEKNNKN